MRKMQQMAACYLRVINHRPTKYDYIHVDWKCKACSRFLKPKRISAVLQDDEEDNTDSEFAAPTTSKSSPQEMRRVIRETIQEEMKKSLQFF